ncbi:MAG TPA: class I SAM-dependent methyltransferase [Gaiellaceae bacterium]|nr:class I SAM-dependent methyltransferase [Gaiellaceae bacterium]
MELRLTSSVRARHADIPAELTAALARDGIEPVAAEDGTITFRGVDGDVRLRLTDDGATLELRGPETVDEENEAGWIAHQVLAPLVAALTPERIGDWITDRWARRPSGAAARAGYRDPTHHRPTFGAVLSALQLRPDDVLLEIGCGGGVFLQEALTSGCRAKAIDHSPEMVALAREVNAEAVAVGRVEIVEGEAENLPFADDTFTCAAMMQVFFFLDAPRVLAECRRVLQPGGRVAVFTVSQEARGTPAAPEPIANRARFYKDAELVQLTREAGFPIASVTHPDLERHARAAGLPDDVVALMKHGTGVGQLLLARDA